jgi:hypothetical protein
MFAFKLLSMNLFNRFAVALIVAYSAGAAVAQSASTAPVAAEPASSKAADIKDPKEAGPQLSLMLGSYTHHFNPKPTHRKVFLLGLEREHANAKLDGIVLFTNSFGQPSVYVYPWGGVYKSIFGVDKLAFKWTGGIIYGYRGEFKNEVANVGGFAPVIIPALSYTFRPGWSAQVNMLGKAAAQFQLNMALN